MDIKNEKERKKQQKEKETGKLLATVVLVR